MEQRAAAIRAVAAMRRAWEDRPRYGSLFGSSDGIRAEEAMLLFALRAAVGTPPRPDEIRALADRWASDVTRRSIADVAEYAERSLARERRPTDEEELAADIAKK